MSAYNVLPEIVLTKKCARYLLTRNAGEKALFTKKSLLIEKAKTKEEKAFQRERQLLLRRQSKTQEIQGEQPYGRFNAVKKFSRTGDENKWESNSDTPLHTRQRRNQGFLLSSKTSVCSLQESVFSVSSDFSDGIHLTPIPQQDTSRSLSSLSCALPPIQPLPHAYSTKTKRRN